jgi:hypothetical protein
MPSSNQSVSLFCFLSASSSRATRAPSLSGKPPFYLLIIISHSSYLGSRRWYGAHWIIQLLISGPIIFAGWAYGSQAKDKLSVGVEISDTHTKLGVTVLVLYILQVLLGLFIHYVKFPSFARSRLHRPPQNYLHAVLGLTIFALAAYQARPLASRLTSHQ